MAHRVAKGLVGGCALLLGVTLSGCGAPQYTYVANSSQSTYFKVPHGWHQISGDACRMRRRSPAARRRVAGRLRGWQYPDGQRLPVLRRRPAVRVRRDRHAHLDREPGAVLRLTAGHLPAGHLHRPAERAQRVPADRFQVDPRREPHPGPGRTRGPGDLRLHLTASTDTFDEVALTNAEQTDVYFLVLHCTEQLLQQRPDRDQRRDVVVYHQELVMRKARAATGMPPGGRPKDEDRQTRKPLGFWDRIKFLVLLGAGVVHPGLVRHGERPAGRVLGRGEDRGPDGLVGVRPDGPGSDPADSLPDQRALGGATTGSGPGRYSAAPSASPTAGSRTGPGSAFRGW